MSFDAQPSLPDQARRAALLGGLTLPLIADLASAPAMPTSAHVKATSNGFVNLLDFVPPSDIRNIASATSKLDHTPFLQRAIVAANNGVSAGAGPGGSVFIPNGTYNVSRIGLRDSVLVGEHRDGTVLRAIGSGSPGEFLVDAALDRDRTTTNTAGNGYCQNLTLDGKDTNRSGLRTYGGGVALESLVVRGFRHGIGVSCAMPIWASLRNVLVHDCDIGIETHSREGDNGTSLKAMATWVYGCRINWHIKQIYYSSFDSCAAQDAKEANFLFEGGANGAGAMYSIGIENVGIEGSGRPIVIRNIREFLLSTPRLIGSDGNHHLVTLDNAAGTVIGFSLPGAVAGGKHHFDVLNHAAGDGAIIVVGGDVTFDPSHRRYFTLIGAAVAGGARRISASRIELDNASEQHRVYLEVGNVDGQPGVRLTTADGKILGMFRCGGGVILSSSGALSQPERNLPIGSEHSYLTNTARITQCKLPNGQVRTITERYDAT